MNTIQDLFQQAQLAEAAYANFSNPNVSTAVALQDNKNGGSFSQSQAADFVTHWRVIDQYTVSSGRLGLSGSGFSATVFESIDHPGQYSFVIRGSENLSSQAGIVDWSAADIKDIGSQGFSLHQAIDLYNYIQSLRTQKEATYQAVYLQSDTVNTAFLAPLWALGGSGNLAYQAAKLALESAGYWVDGATVSSLALGNSATVASDGLGYGRQPDGLAANTTYDVIGHSLGGHLAMIMQRLDPNFVGNVQTFNPPFFDPAISSQLTDRFFSQLSLAEIAATGSSSIASIFESAIYQHYVVSGDVVHNIGTKLPSAQDEATLFTESEASTIAAHKISYITNSLAVYDLFLRLDSGLAAKSPTEALAQLKPLFEAGSNQASLSLESLVNSLSRLFGLSDIPTTSAEFTRDQLYTQVGAIRDAITAGAGIGQKSVVNLTSMSAADIITKAQQQDAEGEAYRYALKELNPFVVTGVNYTQHNANAALDLYDNATGLGLTANWLEDRAAMLTWAIKRNTEDSTATVMDGPEQLFRDLTTRTEIRLGSGSDADRRHFIFGSDRGETLLGGSNDDLLIGGGGNDNLHGDDQGTYRTRDLTLIRQVTTDTNNVTWYQSNFTNTGVEVAATGGADVLYGQSGDDWVNDEAANDAHFHEAERRAA